MTIERAIKLLVNANYSDKWQGNEDLTTAHNMAIKALEKFNDNTCDIISKTHLIERLKNAEEEFKADNMESITSGIDGPFIDGVLSAMFFIRVMILNEPTRGL